MSRRRKTLLILACTVAGLFLAGMAVLHLLGRDEPAPDDSDLILQRQEVPDEENGLTYLAQAEAVLYWPGTKAWNEAGLHPVAPQDAPSDDPLAKAAADISEKVDAMMAGKQWDAALAAEILDRNAASIELFRKAMACPHFQRPMPVGIGTASFPVWDELNMARMLTLRAHALAREGKDEAALEQAVDIVQLGHALERSKGNLLPFLVGFTVKGFGLDAMPSLLKTTTLPPDRLKALADRLGASIDNSEGLAEALRVEYQWSMNMVDQTMKQAESKAAKQTGMMPGNPWGGFWGGVYYRPQETRRMFIEQVRPGVEAASKPLAQMHVSNHIPENQRGPVGQILRGNILGRMMYSIMAVDVVGAMKMKCQSNTGSAVTYAMLAIKAFQAKNGRLPQTLDELVPEFLPAVPLDDFDGKPIRYSPAKKVLYSVGEDFKDGGGMTRDEARAWWNANKRAPDEPLKDDEEPNVWDLPDPSFPIEF